MCLVEQAELQLALWLPSVKSNVTDGRGCLLIVAERSLQPHASVFIRPSHTKRSGIEVTRHFR